MLAQLNAQIRRLPVLMHFAPWLMLAGPLLSLLGYWLGGERGLVISALALTLMALGAAAVRNDAPHPEDPAEPYSRSRFLADLDHRLLLADAEGKGTGCIVMQFDDAKTLLDRHGRAVQTEVIRRIGQRLSDTLRQGDRVIRLEGGGFAIALAPSRRLDLEAIVQLSSRLQARVAEPVSVGGQRLLLTVSAGFSFGGRGGTGGGAELLDSAQIAADDALRFGPGALRAFAPGMARKRAERDAQRAELETALDDGQIRAWFQPQVSADSGELTGFEALARWHSPTRGMVPPSEFLPLISDAGLSERLTEVMVFNALVALSRWDGAGLNVPSIGVNFSSDELRNPMLADKLKWELDRFELQPARLSIEVLETVMASSDTDVIVRNVTELARIGCTIDLDDFGTGHSSITNIRRFSAHRLKIDRSFVTQLERDRSQQQVVAAILSMAEQLGLDTLAEGVESAAEGAMLAQLGCGHLQGFGIGHPMPFDEATNWIVALRGRPKLTWLPGGAAGLSL